MQHTFNTTVFRPTHTRLADSVHGILWEHSDTAVIQPQSAIVDPADFVAYTPPPRVPPSTPHTPAVPVPPPALPEAPVIPPEIANWRARAVLEIAGLLPTVTAALNALEGDAGVVARAAWSAGAPLVRNGPTVLALANLLGLTAAQIDTMFLQAAALDV